MTRPLLVNINTGGELGNHLYTFSWMIQMALLTDAIVVNPAFKPFKDWFDDPVFNGVPYWPTSKGSLSVGQKLLLLPFSYPLLKVHHHYRIANAFRLDELHNHPIYKYLVSLGLGYIAYDWLVAGRHAGNPLKPTFLLADGNRDFYSSSVVEYIRSKKLVLLDSVAISPCFSSGVVNILRDFLRPKKTFIDKAQIILDKLRSAADLVIGVSIRQGDFKIWLGGIWYVDHEIFKKVIEAASQYFLPRRCAWAVCSDGHIDESIFTDLDYSVVPPGPPVHLSVLMGCDYIVGTANSTFIEWASFLGNVPLHAVSQNDAIGAHLLDFKVFGLESET